VWFESMTKNRMFMLNDVLRKSKQYYSKEVMAKANESPQRFQQNSFSEEPTVHHREIEQVLDCVKKVDINLIILLVFFILTF